MKHICNECGKRGCWDWALQNCEYCKEAVNGRWNTLVFCATNFRKKDKPTLKNKILKIIGFSGKK